MADDNDEQIPSTSGLSIFNYKMETCDITNNDDETIPFIDLCSDEEGNEIM